MALPTLVLRSDSAAGGRFRGFAKTDEKLRPEAESIYAATLKEITIAERLSEAPRVLDRYEDHTDSPSYALWNSTDIRLEHIFRLLSLCLPREPLHVAFQALHTDDAYLRGTALEYLESILPSGVRENLWQFLEGPSRKLRTAGRRITFSRNSCSLATGSN